VSNASLAAFINSLSAKHLRKIVLDLAGTDDQVYRRLLRERALKGSDDPTKLIAHFQNSLDKLLNKSSRQGLFESWDEAFNWLECIETELLPIAPHAALDLVEQCIAADEIFFNNHYCDDESALLMQNACIFWIRVAASCGGDQQIWIGRVYDMYCADAYCAREELLLQAHILLDSSALRTLAKKLKNDLQLGLKNEFLAKSAIESVLNTTHTHTE
jgi:hypothetical protein